MFWMWLACSGDVQELSVPDTTLLEASQEVIFASTEALGPHRLRSIYVRTEYHGDEIRNQYKEILSIDWMDWDHWQVTQMIDDEVVTQVMVMDGKCLEQVGGQYIKRPDGEPYRVQLRSMWNQWDGLMRHFEPHTTWIEKGTSDIEGRKTQQYTANFTSPVDHRVGLSPKYLTAEVWVDQQSAVRLVGKVDAVLIKDAYKKEVNFTVERSDIGTDAVEERLAKQWSRIQVLQE